MAFDDPQLPCTVYVRHIEGDKEPHFPDPELAIWHRVDAIACTEAMSLKTTSMVGCFVISCAMLEERNSFGPGFRAICRSNSAATSFQRTL
jgi:hypothetical protein